jgi:hypothetical protein
VSDRAIERFVERSINLWTNLEQEALCALSCRETALEGGGRIGVRLLSNRGRIDALSQVRDYVSKRTKQRHGVGCAA